MKMSAESYRKTLDTIILDGLNIISAFDKELNNDYDRFEKIRLECKEDIEKIIINRCELKSKQGRRRKKDVEKTNQTLESVSENVEESEVSSVQLSTEKPRRMASQIASLLFKKQVETFHGKLRRPEESDDIVSHHRAQIIREVAVKQEKIDVPDVDQTKSSELMPPPDPVKPKRGRTRKTKAEIDSSDTENEAPRTTRPTRSKTRQVKNNEKDEPKRSTRNKTKKNDSDIIIVPNAPVLRITISDNEENAAEDAFEDLPESIVDEIDKNSNVENDTESLKKEIAKNTVEVLLERLPLNEINKNIESDLDLVENNNIKKNKEIDKPIIKDETNNKKEKKRETKKKTRKERKLEVDSQESASEMEKENVNDDKENVNKNENKENADVNAEGKKHARTWSSEDDENQRSSKRTKKINKKGNKKEKTVIEKIPFVALENIKIEKDVSLYEDALSNSIEPSNQTYAVQNLNTPTFNSTITISKPPNANSTFICGPTLNQTITINKALTPKSTENETDLLKKHGLTECSVVLKNKLEVDNKKVMEDVPEVESSPETPEKQPEVSENESPGLQSPSWQKPKAVQTVQNDSLFTEDDSDVSPVKKQIPVIKQKKNKKITTSSESSPEKNTPKDKKSKRGIKTKPMFSPYANSPVKKRVAAFEKLQEKNELPTTSRVTRTKTRKLIEEKQKETSGNKENTQAPSKIPSSKFITPLTNHKLKSMIPSTDSKLNRPGLMSSKNNLQNSSTISTSSESLQRTQSAVKLSRKELQERREEEQKRKLEKEEEARKKKEALLHAKIEEQKRLREEKMLRAKELREENERKKEERLRQALIEKEEKMREEQERKKAYYAQKALEMEEHRKLVEKNKLAKQREEMLRQKEEEEQKRLALKKQMEAKQKKKYKPPPLPTADNSDTDSEDENSVRKRVPIPAWAHKQRLYPVLSAMSYIPNSVLVNFYNIEPTTPDLSLIFEYIPQNYLKRNSSAVWRTPPRYSTLPKF